MGYFKGIIEDQPSGVRHYMLIASSDLWACASRIHEHLVGGGYAARACSGFAKGYLTGDNADLRKDSDAIAWGYNGTGPLYCSSAMMYATLPGCGHHYGGVGSWRRFTKKEVTIVKRFMHEVVSKLPDNWYMTEAEIKAWIKDGTLPACILQPKEELLI